MALARVTTWNAGDVLTAAAQNGEFNNILNNALSLISPLTGNLNCNSRQLTNLLFETNTATQTAANAGRVYYQTTENQIHLDDGTNIRRVPTIASVARGDLIYASATNQWARLGIGAAARFVRSDGTDVAWSQVALATDVTGTLAAAQFPALTGDITTVAGALATTLRSTGPGATGPLGSATAVPIVTIDAQGRVTALTSTTPTFSLTASNNTEATTTSTTSVALRTITGLSITAGQGALVCASLRKTSGAAAAANVGLTINSTSVRGLQNWSGAVDAANSGYLWVWIPPRTTNYLQSGVLTNGSNSNGFTWASFNTALPAATITQISIDASVDSASITMGCTDVKVYTIIN